VDERFRRDRARASTAAVATATDSPWDALALLGNAHLQMRYGAPRAMDHLVL
jgi:hypothetical protein